MIPHLDRSRSPSPVSDPLPPEAIPYDAFMSNNFKNPEVKKDNIKPEEHVRGFYEFGPYGDICRAWEYILKEHFPMASNEQLEHLLKEFFSKAGEMLVPSQFNTNGST